MAACVSSAVADEALCATDKKKNFQRLAGLLMCGGVTLLREVFDTIHPPANLSVKLNDPATKTQLKGAKLTKPEWDCVYPSPGMCGKSTDFDITLLFRLLRTICSLTPPATGWDKLPINADHSREADLARIKYYRNSVYGHNRTMEISDSDFAYLWKEISEALLRIAGNISTAKRDEWKESINKLFRDPLTPDAGRYVAELQSWYKKDRDTKDEVEKWGNTMEQLMNDKQEQITMLNTKLQELTIKHNILLEHVISIRTTIESTKPGGSSITQSQFPNTPLVQQPGRQSENACIPGPIPPEQPQTEGAVGTSSSWELQQNDPTDLDIWQVILSSCNFALLFEKLRMKFSVDVQSSRLGSLVITVSCSSLEVLEGLWKDHCTGHLSEMVQETLVTAEVLQELCLSEVKLKTIISEKEYKACKQLFTQGNENLQQLTRETPSATTTSTSDDSDENGSLKIQEATSQGAVMVPTSLDNRPVSDTVLHDIGSGLGTSWKRLGRCLGIPEKDLKAIDMKEHDKKRKGILMLNMWKETWSEYATRVVLQEALEEIGRPDPLQKGTVIEPDLPLLVEDSASSLENTRVSHELLFDLAKNFNPSWKILGRHLGIPEDTLGNIDMGYLPTAGKCVAMLDNWKRRWGDEATVRLLSEALENIRSDLSTKVKAMVKENTPVSHKLLCDLAKNFNPSWKILGRHLGIPEDALTHIDMENLRTEEKYMATLGYWKRRWGDEATVRVLNEALEKTGRNDLAKTTKVSTGVTERKIRHPDLPAGTRRATMMKPTRLENKLHALAMRLGSAWKVLGGHLGIPKNEITIIDVDNQFALQKSTAMFDKWKRRRGDEITVRVLREALEKTGTSDLLELLKAPRMMMELTSLDRPVSDTLLHELTMGLGTSFKTLGVHLRIPDYVLTNIDEENRRVEEKYVAVFGKWKRRWGDEATESVLREALEKTGRSDLLEIAQGETKTKMPHRPAARAAKLAAYGHKRREFSFRLEAATGAAEPAAYEQTYVKHSEIPKGENYIAEYGYVMTINNYIYPSSRLSLRTHEKESMECLKHLFLFKFGFRLEEHENLTKNEMLKVLTHTAEKDFSTHDCFVCVIQCEESHGGIFGIDDEVINPKTITSLFTRDKCPSLDGKPKIFLIEALEKHQTFKGPGSGPPLRPVISEDDFLIWYVPRIQERLSLFVPHLEFLAYTLERVTSSRDLMEILMEQNKKIAESNYPFPPPYLVSTLTKKVFLKRK